MNDQRLDDVKLLGRSVYISHGRLVVLGRELRRLRKDRRMVGGKTNHKLPRFLDLNDQSRLSPRRRWADPVRLT